MNRTFYWLIIFLFFSYFPATNVQAQEYLDWNSLKINNQIPLECKKADLIQLLGKPDKIVTPKENDYCASYFQSDIKFLYWGESQFESSGSKAVISSIDFESNKIKLVSPNITLDNSVTLETIKRLFPVAVKQAIILDIDKKGKVLSVRIATAKEEIDDQWLLFFKNGKLIRIDHYQPC